MQTELTIGALSDQTGVNIETIRYYERIALTPKPPRSANGRRVYDAAAARRLAFIRRARTLGFAIDDIRALLAMADGGGCCADVYALTQRRLDDINAKIDDLRRMQRVLTETAERCSRDASPECPIIDALAGDRPGPLKKSTRDRPAAGRKTARPTLVKRRRVRS
jgi:MerR family mercuric resistance operon transcriptional regulator